MPTEYKFHPIADIFPLMTASEIAELAKDIKANEMQVPIVFYQKKILNGRNRYLACIQAEVEPQYIEYAGNDAIA